MLVVRLLPLAVLCVIQGSALSAPADDIEGDEVILIEGEAPLTPEAGQPTTTVDSAQLRSRLPRSVPDALRYEPGVYVQQTSAGQGSAFVRGRTGQQTVLLFDGIRLNNSLYRQGPNQYFFTIDLQTVDHIDVRRGGASTYYGSDAIAGVLNAVPARPAPGTLSARPRARAQLTTADSARGGRASIDARISDRATFVGGVGFRSVGQLESGGPLRGERITVAPQIPRFSDDGRTQLGTGFDELTLDARVQYNVNDTWRVTGAAYEYRQLDAPRTDQCPPPFAPITECLVLDEQFHSIGYIATEGAAGPFAKHIWAALSLQRQRERRTRDRPDSNVQNGGRDEVWTLGLAARVATAWHPVGRHRKARLLYGSDTYYDSVNSAAWTILTDVKYTDVLSRGQYLSDSNYTTGGVFAAPELYLGPRFTLRGGGRLGWSDATAPSDPHSGTLAIDRRWYSVVGYSSLQFRPHRTMALIATIDRSFRAPNLDDLTSRQATGPGFQFENPALAPEAALSAEIGARLRRRRVRAEMWLYVSTLSNAITRAQRGAGDCPVVTASCETAWFRYQLINLDGSSRIFGGELMTEAEVIAGISVRATLSYARGEGQNPQQRPSDAALPYVERVPLSRIPPLNGTGEVRWQRGPWQLSASMRWARLQDRLAITDLSDERIPQGGTPGFVVFDVHAGYRLDEHLRVDITFENLSDAAYRYHGSSINGPARGLLASMEVGL